MAQMPALLPKEVEIQRLKKIWLVVIAMGSTAASVEVDNFVDGSLHQTSIRDSAFTPAHWWLYSHFVALPLGCLLYTSPSPRDLSTSRMPSSA